jgi:hypothetical protein
LERGTFGGGQGNLYVYAGDAPLNLIDPSGLDVTVAYTGGHVAIQVNNGPLVGCHPDPGPGQNPVKGLVPGATEIENKSTILDTVTLRTSREQDREVNAAIAALIANPGMYNAVANNCTISVADILRGAGIINSAPTSFIPNVFFENLKSGAYGGDIIK